LRPALEHCGHTIGSLSICVGRVAERVRVSSCRASVSTARRFEADGLGMRHTVGVLHCYANQIHAIGDAIRHPDLNVRRSAWPDLIGRDLDPKRRTRRCGGQRKNPNQDRNRHSDGGDSKDTLLQLDSVLQIASLSLIRRYGTSMIFFQKQPSLLPSAVIKSAAKTVSLSEEHPGNVYEPLGRVR